MEAWRAGTAAGTAEGTAAGTAAGTEAGASAPWSGPGGKAVVLAYKARTTAEEDPVVVNLVDLSGSLGGRPLGTPVPGCLD